jgi:hypothetical protein
LRGYQLREDLLLAGGYKSDVAEPAFEEALTVLELLWAKLTGANRAKIVADSSFEIYIFIRVLEKYMDEQTQPYKASMVPSSGQLGFYSCKSNRQLPQNC